MQSYIKFSLLILLLMVFSSCIQKREPSPPVAKIVPKTNTLNGVTWTDNYYWLRERGSADVLNYLKAENAYTDAVMASSKKVEDKLYKEIKSRIKENDLSVPEKEDDYYYYRRTEEGKQYPINCRKKGLNGEEEILLDQNRLAQGHHYLDLGIFKISPNQNILAYSIDTNGSELYTIYFKDLTTGKLLPDRIPNSSTSFEWANDNKTVFYTVLDEAKRPFKLYRHRLGTDYKDDVLIYYEPDEAYELSISKTKSKQYLLMTLESNTTTEVRYLKADNPTGKFKIIHPRQHEMEYYVFHRGNKFYIMTNDKAKNFKLMTVSVKHPAKKNWKAFLPSSDSIKIDDVDMFKDYLVVYERKDGFRQIYVYNFKNKKSYYVKFPEKVYTYFQGKNRDFKSHLLRFTYTSLITPRTVYDFNMDDQSWNLKKEYKVLGGYDKSQYQMEQVYATASDGTKIPISLVYKKGMVKNGKNPFCLYGYGSYGISIDPYFSSVRLSLLNRGFVYGIAHVRGGGEMGRYWYEDGKLLHKKNTFTDFIACAEYLIKEKYTSPEELVASGGSAGGMLMGAVANMRPDLFKVIIANVPFVDVINTMLDPSLPLTVPEYEEWGNPNVKKYFDYMYSYSPYDNVKAQAYPNMLITGGLNDARVQYWEPAKWTAKLRALKTDHNLLLLKMNMGQGHLGASGRYDYYKEIAFEYAFIFKVLGIKA